MDQLFKAALGLEAGPVFAGNPLRVVKARLEPVVIHIAVGGDERAAGKVTADNRRVFSPLHHVYDFVDCLKALFLFPGFPVKATFPILIEINHGTFVEGAFRAPELSL